MANWLILLSLKYVFIYLFIPENLMLQNKDMRIKKRKVKERMML